MQIHPPHLRDERLAWLAVEPALRHGFWGRLFGRGKGHAAVDDRNTDAAPTPDSPGLAIGEAGGQPVPPYDIGRPEPAHPDRGTVIAPTGGQTASPGQDSFPLSRKMQRYAVAVDRVVPRMSADERAQLRATGRVPSWFLDAVKKEYKSIHF